MLKGLTVKCTFTKKYRELFAIRRLGLWNADVNFTDGDIETGCYVADQLP